MRFNVIFLLWLVVADVMAQEIRGKVVDEDSKPISYANVVLLTADSVFIDGTVTGDTGEFLFPSSLTRNEGYRIRVSCIGYEPISMLCKSDSIGDIRMSQQANMLSEVTVTPPDYKMKGNGLVVSIQNTALSHMDDVGKMLEFIPGLQSNSNGLYVFGKGTPLVYLNGRILNNLTELQKLRPSDIATVEIIKNPGAAYSAASQAVVKIRTVRKKGEGMSVDLMTYFQLARMTRIGETVQTNYRTEKFDVFAYLYYLRANDYETENNRYDVQSASPFELSSMLKSYTYKNNYSGQIGFDYYFNDRQNIGAYYTFTYHDIHGKDYEQASIHENGKTTDEQDYTTRIGLSCPEHRINAYYSGHAGPVDISFNNDLFWSDNKQSHKVNGSSETHGPQYAVTLNRLKNNLAASDLSLRYRTEISTWELGAAYNHVSRFNDHDSEGGIELTEYQKIKENKWAVYANCQLSINKWEIDAGLRFEHYRYDYYKNGMHIDGQSKLYRDIYPALSISRPVGNADISVSYSAKSQKPPYNALDGNIKFESRNIYTGGNPLLKPSRIDDVQLAMLYRGLAVSADYIRMRNPLYFTYTFYNPEQTVILASYDNYPRVNLFQAEVSYSKKVGIWRPQLTVDFMKGDYKFEQKGRIYRQDTPLFTFNFNHTFSLPRQWYVYLYTLYQTKGCNENGLRLTDRGRISLYVVKNWSNFTVSVLLNDITRSYKQSYSAISPACVFHTSQYMDTQNIQINIRYRFNTTRSKYKGSSAAAEELNRM